MDKWTSDFDLHDHTLIFVHVMFDSEVRQLC